MNISKQIRTIIGSVTRRSYSTVKSLSEVDTKTYNQVKKVGASRIKRNGIIDLTWTDNSKSEFSSIFLRDSCQCEICFNSASKQRRIDTCNEISLDISPTKINIDSDIVRLTWPDGHLSTFTHDYLWKKSYKVNEKNLTESKDVSYIETQKWDADKLKGKIPRHDLKSVLLNMQDRYNWYSDLSRYGITLIEGAEKKEGELNKVKEFFGGYIKNSHYGNIFQVVYKHLPSSQAYTSEAILPHMDLPHYWHPPGIQALHCIEQFSGDGADNTFIDGFNIIEKLRTQYPEFYHILTTYNVIYRDIGTDYYGDFETFYERPIIGVEKGRVNSLDYSNWLRDYTMNGTAMEIQNFYKAYYQLTHMINDRENVLQYKLKEGEIAIFNNRRILHGRRSYNPSQTSSGRFYEGCYFDWDALWWSIRAIKRNLDTIKQN